MFSPMDIGILAGVALLAFGPKTFPQLRSVLNQTKSRPRLGAGRLTVEHRDSTRVKNLLSKAHAYKFVIRPVARLAMLSTVFIGAGLLLDFFMKGRSCHFGVITLVALSICTICTIVVFCSIFSILSRSYLHCCFDQIAHKLTYWILGMNVLVFACGAFPEIIGFRNMLSAALAMLAVSVIAVFCKLAARLWVLQKNPELIQQIRRP